VSFIEYLLSFYSASNKKETVLIPHYCC